jgi:hypothetical protein
MIMIKIAVTSLNIVLFFINPLFNFVLPAPQKGETLKFTAPGKTWGSCPHLGTSAESTT